MATATTARLTLEEYHQRYEGESGYEFWHGEAVRKPMVTRLHSALQIVLANHFYRVGYISSVETDLRVDPNWEPRPDVMGELAPDSQPYPTKPVAVVAEVLSPSDTMSMVFEKCRNYDRIGIPRIFVFDPEARVAWEWSRETENLERIQELRLGSGSGMSVHALADVWDELDRRMRRA